MITDKLIRVNQLGNSATNLYHISERRKGLGETKEYSLRQIERKIVKNT